MLFKRVLATGLPLNGRDEYLDKVVKELDKLEYKARVYKVFDYMKNIGKKLGYPNITRENILDLNQDTLARLREYALKEIDESIRDSKNMIYTLSLHQTSL